MARKMHTFVVTFLTLLTVVDGQSNCSLYNPCGQRGYCVDNAAGEWTCQCKFWWEGTICDIQTSSGKEVIVVGCILAVLLVIYYGLNILRKIRNRKRKKKEKKKDKEELKDPKLLGLALTHVKRLARLTSCLITLLVLLIAAGALVAKWSIVQPIHNDMVYKFKNNLSLYYDPNPFCDTINRGEVDLITFPVACLLIVIFIIKTKRTSLLSDRCNGYGAPPIPTDFLSPINRKFAAVIFAICADELFDILRNIFNGEATNADRVILIYLLRILRVLIIGIRYYPLLAAVYLHSILALTCGTLYAWLDYSVTIINQGMCKSDYYPTVDEYEFTSNASYLIDFFNYYGTGSSLIAIQLCTDIPRCLCLAYVSVKLPAMLIGKIYRRFKRKTSSKEEQFRKGLTREERVLLHTSDPSSPDMLYVRNLFLSTDKRPRSRAIIARLLPKFIYEWRDDFHFSSRVLCVYSSTCLLLFFITVQACIQIVPSLPGLRVTIQNIIQLISIEFEADLETENGNDNSTNEVNAQTSEFFVPDLIRPYILAVVTTAIIIIIQLVVLLANIRRNLFQAFRGEDCEIPRRKRSKYVYYATGNIHFAGYFIAYLIWGFILTAILTFIFWVIIEAFITYGSARLVETVLKNLIPVVLLGAFKQYLNRLLSQYVFLQHAGEVLSINNRRLLMIFLFFNFFLDAFIGFISSFSRLISSFICGIIYMCRMDYSPLGRKLEAFDDGFKAYCGFIHTECTHRHPVMLVFASHLLYQLKLKQFEAHSIPNTFDDLVIIENNSPVKMSNSKQTRYNRAIRKWQLGVFLTRNPKIVFLRKTYLNQLNIDEVHALNDVDGDGRWNMNKRLSIYARRMSACPPGISAETDLNYLEEHRF